MGVVTAAPGPRRVVRRELEMRDLAIGHWQERWETKTFDKRLQPPHREQREMCGEEGGMISNDAL